MAGPGRFACGRPQDGESLGAVEIFQREGGAADSAVVVGAHLRCAAGPAESCHARPTAAIHAGIGAQSPAASPMRISRAERACSVGACHAGTTSVEMRGATAEGSAGEPRTSPRWSVQPAHTGEQFARVSTTARSSAREIRTSGARLPGPWRTARSAQPTRWVRRPSPRTGSTRREKSAAVRVVRTKCLWDKGRFTAATVRPPPTAGLGGPGPTVR
jgi:hypothetical protein